MSIQISSISLTQKEFYFEYYKINVKQKNSIRDKTMDDKLLYIPNDDTQNYPFCRLKSTLNEPTNQNSPKSRKLLS